MILTSTCVIENNLPSKKPSEGFDNYTFSNETNEMCYTANPSARLVY